MEEMRKLLGATTTLRQQQIRATVSQINKKKGKKEIRAINHNQEVLHQIKDGWNSVEGRNKSPLDLVFK